jgi:glycosyltransferase involved in cell wall biosynthesis
MLMHRAAQVVTLSQTMRSEIISRGISENKVHIVPNAVDANRFQPTPASKALIEKYSLRSCKVIGFIGSFYHYEGLDLLIRAFEKAYQKNQAVRLLLVGDGFEFDAMKRQANRSPASAGICLTGRVDYSKVLDYYSLLDMAVFPRYKMRLTELVCPLKPLEAMAMAKPVIGSDVGGIREFVRHEKTGLLFKPGDADELAEAILKLCDSAAMCKSLGEYARKSVLENWHWPVVVKRYKQIYELALEIGKRKNGVMV